MVKGSKVILYCMMCMHCLGFSSWPERTQLIMKWYAYHFHPLGQCYVLYISTQCKFMMNVFICTLSFDQLASFFFLLPYLFDLISFFTHKHGHTYTCKHIHAPYYISLQFDSSLLFENRHWKVQQAMVGCRLIASYSNVKWVFNSILW